MGPYEILSAIGAGGMGEVYKARDTRLDRTVAIKILPEAFAADADRVARFQREAKTLAALNHPNIAQIFGLEQAGEVHALAMEFVAGEDLSDRIARGPIPIDEALPIAKQIADALEAAHEQGVIHRDLKPANIKVRPDGTVKVLDFGLAKMLELQGAQSSLTMSPTLSVHATYAGVILGTAAYMSPEQARGKPVDRRADVWAFGCVLFEMLTGRRAFEGGDTISDAVATILKSEPAWPALPIDTPPHICTLLRRCLRKEPQRRLQAIGEARLAIEEGPAESPAFGGPAATPTGVVSHSRVAWIVAAIALVAATGLAVPAARHMRESLTEPLQARFEVQTPPTSDSGSFALSLDGRQLAFVATAEGAPRLWVRSLDEVTPRVLPGTDGAAYPFWEPDGRAIGFFAAGKLKRVDPAGGAPQTLADAPSGRGGTWNRAGVIVFAPSAELAVPTSVLMRVAAEGGVATPVTRLAAGQGSHRWPQFLPDGQRFLFFVRAEKPDIQGAYLGSLDGGEPTRVLASDAGVLFAPPNFLLYLRQDTLVAVRFDAPRGTVSGDAVPVAHGVGVDTGVFRGAFSVSSAGVLAHRAVSGSQRRQLLWVNRSGTRLGTVGSSDENGLASPELAPDERHVAVIRSAGGAPAVWLIEVGRGVPSRFTFGTPVYQNPVWSPDGQRLAFSSTSNGIPDLFEKLSNGVGDEQPLLVTAESKGSAAWSPDGRFLLYGSQDPTTGVDLWAMPLVGDRKPFPVVRTPFEETAGQFSPDGRWVAYQSNASGPTEVYVQPFPGPGGSRQISTAGGGRPRWRHDGEELFYVAPDTRLMAVPIVLGKDDQTIEPGTPVPLFPTRLASGANIVSGTLSKAQYAVARDGRFLLNTAVDEGTTSPIAVVLNWDAVLKK